MYKCKYIQPVQPYVQFGVELKEIYPPWYLHPSLKNLMYLTQINIRNQNSTRFDIDEICGKTQSDGPIKQRLKLKELMILGRNILNVRVAPGAPLWLLRHFLGLLPSPIFAPKCDANHWLHFASDCYQQLVDCIKTRKNCNHLKFTIAFELAHLPDINLTFLFEFFDLLRFLSSKTLPDSKEVVDNHAALVLAKYFIPCLFERPYTPGILKKIDKKYITILLYVIHFWPELRIQIHDLLISSIDKNETKFHYFSDYLNKYANNNDYLRDIGVQTDQEVECKDSELSLNFTELSEIQAISSDAREEQKIIEDLSKIEVIYDDCNIEFVSPKLNECEKSVKSVNVVSSTPYVKASPSFSTRASKLKRCRKSVKNKKSKSDTSSLSSEKSKGVKVVSKKVRSRNSKNYEIIILELPYKVKRIKTRDIKITTLEKCTKEKRCSRSPRKKKRDKSASMKEEKKNVAEEIEAKPTDSSIKYEIDNNQLLNNNATDEYNSDTFIGKSREKTKCFNLNKINKNPFTSKVDTSSPTYIDFNSPTRSIDFNPQPQSTDNDIFDKITKFGWSYTKSARRKLNLNECQPSTTTTNEKSLYKICFDSEFEFNNCTIDSSIPLTQNCQIGKCVISGKTSKSMIDNLRRVGSRLNFLKFTAKVSASCDDLRSSVKYKKILKSSYSI